jgi:hypothetical protein
MPSKPKPPRKSSFMSACALTVIAALMLFATPARADDDDEKRRPPLPMFLRLEIEYQGDMAQKCEDYRFIKDRIVWVMHRETFKPDASALLRVTLSRVGRIYKGNLEIRDADGSVIWRRPGVGPVRSCISLIEDVATILYVWLPPAPLPEPPPPPPAPPPPPRPAPLSRKPNLPLSHLEFESPPPQQGALPAMPWRIGVNTAVAIGSSPRGVGADFAAEGGRQWRITSAWVLSGEIGLHLGPSPSAVLNGDDVRVNTLQVVGVVAPCMHFHMIFGCTLAQVGGVLGSMSNPDAETSYSSLWVAMGPRGGIEQQLPNASRISLLLFGELPVTIHAAKLWVRQGQMAEPRLLWTTPRFTGTVSAGVRLFF